MDHLHLSTVTKAVINGLPMSQFFFVSTAQSTGNHLFDTRFWDAHHWGRTRRGQQGGSSYLQVQPDLVCPAGPGVAEDHRLITFGIMEQQPERCGGELGTILGKAGGDETNKGHSKEVG